MPKKSKWNSTLPDDINEDSEKHLDEFTNLHSDELESVIHPEEVEPEKQPAKVTPKRKGIVISISKGHVSINENGFGTRIPYNATLHSKLKKGDSIEF